MTTAHMDLMRCVVAVAAAAAVQEMTKNLELCQKSLNEYLDMKKKIFPRFYFVSNVALLDMLSNSNNPLKILPYLGDCFDSLAMLKMEPPAKEGELPNIASSMIAKDGEVCVLTALVMLSVMLR